MEARGARVFKVGSGALGTGWLLGQSTKFWLNIGCVWQLLSESTCAVEAGDGDGSTGGQRKVEGNGFESISSRNLGPEDAGVSRTESDPTRAIRVAISA
jgi:hypothetical protein